jgi:hypothetical protein
MALEQANVGLLLIGVALMNDMQQWLPALAAAVLGWLTWTYRNMLIKEQEASLKFQTDTIEATADLTGRLIAVENILEVELKHIHKTLNELKAQHSTIGNDVTAIRISLGNK